MQIAVTGTPGTGKTSATAKLDSSFPVVNLNEVVESEGFVSGHDTSRDTRIVDLDALETWMRENVPDDAVIESHFAHRFDIDRVVVLRCHPATLEKRLIERGESTDTASENAQSEAIDVILSEAIERHGLDHVYEIETTDRTVAETAAEIDAVIRDEREPSAGTVSYLDYL